MDGIGTKLSPFCVCEMRAKKQQPFCILYVVRRGRFNQRFLISTPPTWAPVLLKFAPPQWCFTPSLTNSLIKWSQAKSARDTDETPSVHLIIYLSGLAIESRSDTNGTPRQSTVCGNSVQKYWGGITGGYIKTPPTPGNYIRYRNEY